MQTPTAVIEASDAYLAEEDVIGIWIAERCAVDGAYSQAGQRLFADWKSWAEDAHEHIGSQKAFYQHLRARGFTDKHEEQGLTFFGIALKP